MFKYPQGHLLLSPNYSWSEAKGLQSFSSAKSTLLQLESNLLNNPSDWEKTFRIHENSVKPHLFLFVLVYIIYIMITNWRYTYFFISHYIISGHILRDPGPPEPRHGTFVFSFLNLHAHHCLPQSYTERFAFLEGHTIDKVDEQCTGATAGSRGTGEHDHPLGQTQHAQCAHGAVWV